MTRTTELFICIMLAVILGLLIVWSAMFWEILLVLEELR